MDACRRTLLRRLSAVAAVAVGAAATPAAWAQSDAVRVFVGFPPGGLPDKLARALAQSLDNAIVENRPGANGRIAAQSVKRAAADGKTLLLVPASAMVHLPHIYDNLGYDPFTDFAPVAQVAENDFALGIPASLPARTLAEFVAWSKAHPADATVASPGQGSAPHLMSILLARATGTELLHIPYKGNALALNDVATARVGGLFATSSVMMPLVERGSIRILATTGPARNPGLPDVPTFRESKIDDLTLVEGNWVLAPARTPPATIERLAQAVRASVASKEMQNVLNGQATPAALGPAEVARAMRTEFDRRGALIRRVGFTFNS